MVFKVVIAALINIVVQVFVVKIVVAGKLVFGSDFAL